MTNLKIHSRSKTKNTPHFRLKRTKVVEEKTKKLLPLKVLVRQG